MQSVTSNAVARALSYLTVEHKTGKKWLDGKDIYSITKIYHHDPNSANQVPLHISNDLDNMTKVDFFTSKISYNDIKWQFFHQGAWGTGLDWTITYYRENTYLMTKFGTAYDPYDFDLQLTFEYTKTTD